MKVAVLADIHSNLVAFQTAIEHLNRWQPDQVIIGGDLVNRGPRPLECLEIFQGNQVENGWRVVRGNHEDYVLRVARPGAPRLGPEFEVHRASYWTYEHLNYAVNALEEMPFQQSSIAPDGGEIRIVHASMRGNRVGIYPYSSDEELRDLIQPAPQVIVVGHTHRPLVRQVGDTLVVNAGSVGLPFDGDHRLAYAQLTWTRDHWQAEIVRLPYDRQAAERDFFASGYQPDGGALVELVLIELRTARSMLYNWSARYQQLANIGEISMEASVRQFLSEEIGD